ncbi:unnamed protein product [Pleuronectes platessa]|uniref:Uncharacterized protein n=1 Tax=Pleuronectes platessa TaxID=8262 RepID=A0A9N7ZEK2_PLEPL|nr:unnamed protein product [Pleuronectes platessa]
MGPSNVIYASHPLVSGRNADRESAEQETTARSKHPAPTALEIISHTLSNPTEVLPTLCWSRPPVPAPGQEGCPGQEATCWATAVRVQMDLFLSCPRTIRILTASESKTGVLLCEESGMSPDPSQSFLSQCERVEQHGSGCKDYRNPAVSQLHPWHPGPSGTGTGKRTHVSSCETGTEKMNSAEHSPALVRRAAWTDDGALNWDWEEAGDFPVHVKSCPSWQQRPPGPGSHQRCQIKSITISWKLFNNPKPSVRETKLGPQHGLARNAAIHREGEAGALAKPFMAREKDL